VRASMGALFDVPVARVRTVEELPGRTIALVAHGGEPLEPDGETTLVVGAEREGLPADVVAACDATATIPVRAESLNAAMAATVALYECNRRMAAP
jgi:TrmH family RNA methyltransferase